MKRILFAVIISSLFFAVSASAQVYTIVLKGGASFDTRYEPLDADWDDSVSMILTDQGNWIALEKIDILDVISDVESSGFGHRLDTSTLVLGSYHEGFEESGGEGGQPGQGTPGAPFDPRANGSVPLDGTLLGPPQSDSFSIEQFVDTGAAGEGGGVPLEYTVFQ